MNLPKLGLFSRLLILFSSTTILLAICIALGVFVMSEREARDFVIERQNELHQMLVGIAKPSMSEEKLKADAKKNRVRMFVERDNARFITKGTFPSVQVLLQHADPIGQLYFSKHQSKYYLLTEHDGVWVGITSQIANFIVYPAWLMYWPWLLALVILIISYLLLKRLLKPVHDSVKSAQMLSLGDLDYQISNHPKNELAMLTKGLNKMATELKTRFEAKNELLMAISHELRTPMARMKISLAMLEQNDIVDDLHTDVVLMDTLIEQLLEGERLEKGNEVLSVSTYFLPTLINDVINEPGIAGRVQVGSELPDLVIRVDAGRIKFVLRNLIKNAINHGDDDTNINLDMAITETDISVIVTDDGPGIPDEYKDKIFEPFSQVTDIKNRSIKGTGLGLYLCQKIMRAHQGDMLVTDNIPKGSIFRFWIPINRIVK